MIVDDEAHRTEVGGELYDRAILEVVTLRDTLFATGEDRLIEAIDAFLLDLAATARRLWSRQDCLARLRDAA